MKLRGLRLPVLPRRWLWIGLGLLVIAAGVTTAITAANTVPESGADVNDLAITANALKPAQCAGLTLTNLVTGSGNINGTAGNDLILGSNGADVIDGLGGDDCIVGGGGDDTIDGGADTDVCIGGAGTNGFANCETVHDP